MKCSNCLSSKISITENIKDIKNLNKMKKNLFTIMLLAINGVLYSQVGINTTSPSATLDILSKGNTSSTKAMEVNDSNNKALVNIYDNGNVGINTPNPNAKLHIVAAANENGFQLQDGTEQDKRVLTSDANGVGTWQVSSKAIQINFVNMNGQQPFISGTTTGVGPHTVFNPATPPTLSGSGSTAITFPSNSRIHLPQGLYQIFVRADVAGNEFAAFGGWMENGGTPYRAYYSYYGNLLANPSFLVDLKNMPAGDSLYFTLCGLTNNPSSSYYDADYTNPGWNITVTVCKIE